MQNLENMLSNIEKDDSYHVLQTLKESPHGRTEKVMNEGNIYIRKYFSHEILDAGREFRLLSELNHPFLPKIHDYYELSGQSVVIEEFVDGFNLSGLVSMSGSLTPEKAVEITRQLCQVSSYLHNQKPYPIIHRDIKPDNIICTMDGQIKLIDFGAAREYKEENTKDTVYVGTLGYASPEQFGFGQTDSRTDIYGIGMTMIHMLTGKAPERGKKIRLSNTSIPVDIQTIIRKSTQFDPTKRYADTNQLLSDLNTLTPNYDGKRTPLRKIKLFLLRPSDEIYPKHLNWPTIVKVMLIPLHLVLFLIFVVIMLNGMFTSTGFGRFDDFLQFTNDFGIFLFFLFPPYVLGFNLFNIDEKIKFFHRFKLIKKILLVMVFIIVGAILLSYLSGLHSEAYVAAKNLAAS